MLGNSTRSKKTYLLIPAMPTPNGRLHLGHIGGPFLAVDILARHLRLTGNKTIVLSGTDSFDSYVTGQAMKEGKTPEQICNNYHELIEHDLKSMQIGIDRFINPLCVEWSQKYSSWLHLVLEQLQAADICSPITETVRLDDKSGRFLTGCWLPGSCPSCSAAVCGYFCEDCGAHFRPEEVVDAPETEISKRVTNLFMKLPANSNLAGRGLDPTILTIYEKFLQQQSGLLRLTANSEWGLSIGNDEIGDRFFNYPFAYAYALMMAELAAELAGESVNALDNDSRIVTIAAFGIDNTIPVLGSIDGITAGLPIYKHFDYYLVNHFLYLNGSKFSTSRRHAIWVDDIIRQLGASSDIIRLFLATIAVRSASGNVEVSELHAFYNKTISWIEGLVVSGLAKLDETSSLDEALIAKLELLLRRQTENLDPQDYRPDKAAGVIDEWLAEGEIRIEKSEGYFWWLKGLALLVYPFMPRLAETLWSALGYEGEPSASDFAAIPIMATQHYLHTNLARLEKVDLEKFSGVKVS